MLTVWCMSTGRKYDDYFVTRLQREVKKYLSLPHRFICIADHEIDHVVTMPPPTPFPGWWGKIGLFKPGVCTTTNLWIDLDTVLTDSLDDLVLEYGGEILAAANNWAQSGHGGVQSSVMVWRQSKFTNEIYRRFKPEWIAWPPKNDGSVPYWGDQEFLTALRDAGDLTVTPINPDWIKSYKYHVRPTHTVPEGCKAVIFHGSPNPDDLEVRRVEKWFQW